MLATVVARALKIKTIGLTGVKGGELTTVSDVVAILVTLTETYMIRELHLPVYHCWRLMLEDRFLEYKRKYSESKRKTFIFHSVLDTSKFIYFFAC